MITVACIVTLYAIAQIYFCALMVIGHRNGRQQ